MQDGFIVAAIGVIVGLIAIITPIIKLNGNIVRLTTLMDQLEKLMNDKTAKLDKRITTHGEEIDKLKIDVAGHEVRIKQLEK